MAYYTFPTYVLIAFIVANERYMGTSRFVYFARIGNKHYPTSTSERSNQWGVNFVDKTLHLLARISSLLSCKNVAKILREYYRASYVLASITMSSAYNSIATFTPKH